MLEPGDPAPWFVANSRVNPRFLFDTLAGRYIALSFYGATDSPIGRRVLADLYANMNFFEPDLRIFCGVSNDQADFARLATAPEHGAILHFFDPDRAIARGYGLLANNGTVQPATYIIDERLRVLNAIPIAGDGKGHFTAVAQALGQLPPIAASTMWAPVLMLDRVFEREFCRELINRYEAKGGIESYFMREVDGKTTGVMDYRFKRRTDYIIEDQALMQEVNSRIQKRITVEIRRAYNFNVTRVERHLVGCYDATQGGHFNPHRDNTTKGTAHRRFAVSINLNTEEFEGGDLRFPEYGPRRYRPATGSAVVFGCSLLHEVCPVTRGKRYAFLPFLYDEEAAKIRDQNKQFVSKEVLDQNQP